MAVLSSWRGKGSRGMPLHTVGNAYVLYSTEQISPQAQSLAMNVAQDPENDVVVLDAPGRMSVLTWESVAQALPRRRRAGIRLVICGDNAEPSSLVGQWLSERLNRTVVAPHGTVLRAAGGALFVHSGAGTGWIRYRPGREPQWEGKRFPRPEWDGLAAEANPTSSTGVAEPIPGGVWIHDSTAGEAIQPHREWLHANVPCQPGILVVLLGCPGTGKLPLDDVHRFWRRLGEEDRRRVRFVGYGPIDVPGRDPFGQAVADALGTPVVCYSGVPVGPPARPQLFTVDEDGRLCWQSFAEELAYTPRERPSAPAPSPRIIRHRIPLELGEELGAGVYWYAEDAVVEVLQSGLWLRPSEAPRDADRIRAALADPERPALVFDDANGPRAKRMRTLAADVAAQLDPATRERTELLAASAVVAASSRGPARAVGTIGEEAPTPFSAEETVPGTPVQAPPPLAPASVAPTPAPVTPALPIPQVAASDWAEETPPMAPVPALPEPDPAFVLPPPPPLLVPRSREPAVVPPPLAPSALSPVEPVMDMPIQAILAGSSPTVDAPTGDAPTGDAPTVGAPTAETPTGDGPAAEPPAIAVRETIEARPAAMPPPSQRPRPRLQPIPDRATSALPPPGRGLTEERAWLRRTLSKEFDLVATTVSRVLSQHPVLLRGEGISPDDALTDSVAVRLYLSAKGRVIDAALRSARKGPHVPLARCAVAGLTRLPSHRGASWLATSLTADQWELLAGRIMLTEWGFLNALIEPSGDLSGDTDVLIWAMTARRTELLEPSDDDHAGSRVLFLPGTSFKILERKEPAGDRRGRLLLREVGASEINPDGRVRDNRTSFDELAVKSLNAYATRWADAESPSRIGAAARPRFHAVPGLAESSEESR
ncbi:hypothetical protein [Actinoplanes sp. HUAS TT8]|uniref:hypothetical protein n=1 Tax=Actinoplanes sp. HUAS TT8 TaxID=3447453 RepID=UPI003F51BEA2